MCCLRVDFTALVGEMDSVALPSELCNRQEVTMKLRHVEDILEYSLLAKSC